MRKEIKKIEKIEREKKLAEELDYVTLQEIVVDPKKFRRKTFIKSIHCSPAEYNEYVYTTKIAELNIRAGKAYSARCWWGGVDIGNAFELRLTPDQAKAFAKAFPVGGDFTDIAIWFSGIIDTGSTPVFYLKRLPGFWPSK